MGVQSFMLTLLASSIVMSALALIYMAAGPLLSKRYCEKWRYYAWLIIVIGLIVPFRPTFSNALIVIEPASATSPSAAFQIDGRMPRASEILAANQAPSEATATDTAQRDSRAADNAQHGLPASTPMAAPIETPAAAAPAIENAVITPITQNITFTWYQMAMFIWLAGLIVFIIIHAMRHYRFTKMLKRWSESITDEKYLELLQNIKQEMKISAHIGLFRCVGISSPMMSGFRMPRILLPETDFTIEELHFILRHELIHYKRKDLYYKCLVLIATAIHWFNPIVYLMARAINIQCEISCDDEVLRDTDPHTRRHYGETIIGVVRYQSKLETALSTNFYGGKNGLRKRISSIMDANHGVRKMGIAVFCVIMLATLGTGLVFSMNDQTDADLHVPVYKEIGNFDIHANPVLNIVLAGHEPFLFMNSAAQIFERMHEGVTINIERIGSPRHAQDMFIANLYEGSIAPDIFAVTAGMEFYLANSTLLVDLYELMTHDPSFNTEDYFMEVFEALKVNGRLPYVSICFMIDFIGLSVNAPIEARKMFLATETMSYAEMINIYNSIPDRGGLWMTPSMHHRNDMLNRNSFVDYRHRISGFNEPKFIDFLYSMREMQQNEPPTETRRPGGGFTAEDNMFRRYFYPGTKYHVLLPPSLRQEVWGEIGFTEFRPYTDAHGDINLNTIIEPSLAINANSDNIGLAWEFMKFMLSEELAEALFFVSSIDGSLSPAFAPRAFVNRNLNRQAMEVSFTRIIVNELGIELTDEIKYDISGAIREFERLADMPMAHRWVWPPYELSARMHEILTDFEERWLSPAETAELLHRAALAVFEEW